MLYYSKFNAMDDILIFLTGWIDLPEPVKNFHATYVQDSKITLEWDPVIKKSMCYNLNLSLSNNTKHLYLI